MTKISNPLGEKIMKKNMGSVDRIFRTILAFVFVILFLTKIVVGTWGIILLGLAAILLITSLFSICPLYKLFGFDTNPKK